MACEDVVIQRSTARALDDRYEVSGRARAAPQALEIDQLLRDGARVFINVCHFSLALTSFWQGCLRLPCARIVSAT